jgi:hypothetical protein
MAVLLACVGQAPRLETRPGRQAMLVIGFLDAGHPYPSGEADPGVRIAAGPLNGQRCDPAINQTVTDSTGWFRLPLPAQGPTERGWMICMAFTPSSPPVYPMFVYEGRGMDSLRIYCRGHGPGGRPECRYVAWEDRFHWPGGEHYNSVPVPPN